MCDFSPKLIAWMDRELPENEAAEIKSHLAACGACRKRLAAYQQASGAFDAYCEAFMAAQTRRPGASRWVLAAAGAGAIAAAAIAALFVLPRARVAQVRASVPASAAAPRSAIETNKAARLVQQPAQRTTTKLRHRSPAPAPQTETARRETPAAEPRAAAAPAASAFPAEPPIEIAIPADAMFPPGAVPPGVSFTADLTIAADGSAERLGLRPRLAGFERRANQP